MITLDNHNILGYDYGGLFTTDEKWIHPQRQIDTYEVIYVVAGTVYIEESANRYRLDSGAVLILSPGQVHGGYEYSTGKTSFYWAHFHLHDGTALQEAVELTPGSLLLSDGYRFSAFFKQLLHIANTPGYPPYTVDGALLLLLGELALMQKSSVMPQSRLAFDVAEWIRINSGKKLTAAAVAEHFGYHSDYLCSLMRQTFAVSLKQYIHEERMKYVKNLLLTTEYSMKQLANNLGWDNENQFIHFFKYHEGVSPAKYRNLFYNTHWNNR